MTANGKRSRPPLLTLKKHLDSSSQADMIEYLRFWSPHEKHRNGRAALSQKLYRLMSDENVVYAKVDLLSEKVRHVLLALLRKQGYTSDLQGLFRGMEGLEMEYYEGEAALTALSRRGFVRISRAQDWLHYGRSVYAIPREAALVMRGLAGADRRPLDQILLHARHRPSPIEAAAADSEEVEPVALPDSVEEAIASLPNEGLRTVAREGIDRYGGLLTRHEFLESFRERGIAWESSRFLDEFGRRGIGTVGHVDLRERGIGVDDDLLVFFHEVVERRAEERRGEAPAYDLVLRAHGDLMSDLRTALAMAEETPLRVAKEGSVYKAVRARLSERLQFPLQPLLDRDEITGRVLSLARGLGLLCEDDEGDLILTEKAHAWNGRPLIERVTEAYGLVLRDSSGTLRTHHLLQVQPLLLELLTASEQPGQSGETMRWWPGTTLGMLARNRYLLQLARRDPSSSGAPMGISHSALTELGAAAQDLAFKELFVLGLTEVAIRGKEPAGVRLSPFGRRVLLGEKGEPAATTKPLIVNPDFEILLLPEGDTEELLHELDRLASRTRTGEVVHLRLERERVEAATANGETAESLLELLTAHSRAPLPQNIVYSINEWAGKVRTASLQRGILFTANDPAVIQSLLQHPTLAACVLRVVDDCTVFLVETALERQIAQELRALGVYIK